MWDIALFADEILLLYSKDLVVYKPYLFFMLIGGLISITAGSCGTFMIMAGLEKENLLLQFIKAIFIITLASYFIPIYGLLAVVVLYITFLLFINIAQLIYISRRLTINPFSNSLFSLLLITVPFMLFAIRQDYVFNSFHFFLLPIVVYMTYFQ